MSRYIKSLERLIEELSHLPTIGPKSAERMALYLIKAPAQRAEALAQAIIDAKEKARKCSRCNFFADEALCPLCKEDRRERVICVVEDPQDVIAIERTGRYQGRYHVLWGKLSPLDGTGPDELPIRRLLERIRQEQISEVIIATSSGREGETTARYLYQLVNKLGVSITRIARGIPMGSNIGHIDQATISEALEGRRELRA